jgi:hypothetical protein
MTAAEMVEGVCTVETSVKGFGLYAMLCGCIPIEDGVVVSEDDELGSSSVSREGISDTSCTVHTALSHWKFLLVPID